ncbi:hypothetical protein THITH_04230 [Thioalkalivibrio paradoxus ARh 1]|uniref:Uncharacterized protein n=1 Tax=Thioalkalivibrio paradoxus ARh 1 TaxID=713585 RepID=W0DSG6_9GAMM|nr:hypothetical protein THITH_04230 [Thioalkalivibrio paradoxus ARh 1]
MFGLQVLGLAAGFITHVMLARLMGDPGQYGWVAVGQNVAQILAALVAFGIPMVIMRRASQLSATGEHQAILALRRLGSAALMRTTGLVLVPALILAAGAYFWPSGGTGEIVLVLVLALLAAPFLALSRLYTGFSRTYGWFGLSVAPDRLWRPLLVLLLALFQWWLWPPLVAAQALLAFVVASVVVALSMGFVTGRRQRARASVQPGPGNDVAFTGSLWRVSAVFGAQSILDVVVRRSDVILVGLMVGPASAGIYFAASRIAELLSMPSAAVGTVIAPRYARRRQMNDHHGLQRLVTLSAHASFWPTLAGVVLMFWLGEWVLAWFGEEFRAGTEILALLLLARLVLASAGRLQALLNMAGAEQSVLRLQIGTAILNLFLLLILIPWYGAVGAALAHLLVWTTWVVVGSLITRRQLGIRPGILGMLWRPTHE